MTLKQDKEPTPKPEPKEVVTEPTKEVKAKEAPETGKGKEGTTPEPADRWTGKSAEELLNIVREQDSMIGKQSTTIDTQKKDLEYYEQQVSQAQTPRYPQTPQFPNPYGQQTFDPYGNPIAPPPSPYGIPLRGQPQQEPVPSLNWYEDPAGSTQALVRKELAQAEQKRMVEERMRYSQEMKSAYEEGKYRAVKGNSKLFRGIEREVEGGIMAGVQRGVFSPADLRREDTWEMAARLARLQRNEFSYLQPESPAPMASPHSEIPASMTEETRVPIDLTGEHKTIAETFGLTEEEIEDSVKRRGAE